MSGKRKAISDLGGYFAKIARAFARDYGARVVMGPAGTIPTADLVNKIITLPCDIDMAGPHLRQTIEGLLDHEAGHIRAEVDFKGEERASALLRKVTHPAHHQLFNVFEDARQEEVSKRRWPGVKRNLETKNDVMFRLGRDKILKAIDEGVPPSDAAVFMWGLNKRLRQGDWPDCMTEKVMKLAEECEDIMERAEHMWCPRDADTLACEMRTRLAKLAEPPPPPMPPPEDSDEGEDDDDSDDAPPGPPPPDDDEDEDDEEGAGDGEGDEPEPESGDEEDDEEEDDGAGSGGADEGEDEGEDDDDADSKPDDKEDEEEGDDDGSGGASDEDDEDDEEDEDGSDAGGSPDDSDSGSDEDSVPSTPDPDTTEVANELLEKLAKDKGETPEEEAWANVTHELTEERTSSETYHLPHPAAAQLDEIIVQEKAPHSYRDALEKARPVISVLVRRLTLWLRAQIPQLIGDQIEGDIDEEALVYVSAGENRIFETEKPGLQLDTAWFVLIDQSGSMGSGSHSRSYWTRIAAIALGEALHRCRIPFEMWGWDTDKERPVRTDKIHTRFGSQRHFQYKTFDETWPRVRQRTGQITGHLENDDTSAVYFAARRLIQRKEHHKVLLVLTDGQPAHRGVYTRHSGWGRRQLRDTLRRARRAGITDIGVGIQCDYVKDIYDNHIVVKNLSTFARDLVGLIRKTVRLS